MGWFRGDWRVTPDGKRMFFLQEVQSDWASDIVEFGAAKPLIPLAPEGTLPPGYTIKDDDVNDNYFKGAEEWGIYDETGVKVGGAVKAVPDDEALKGVRTRNRSEAIDHAVVIYNERAELKNKENDGVADMPFRENWHEVVLKKAIRYAVENVAEVIGFRFNVTACVKLLTL